MPSVTPSQLKGMGQVPIPGSIPIPQNASLEFKQVWDWLFGRTGQLKIQATQFAENAVKTMYGLEPDCSLPPSGLPIVPNASPPRFCIASIAGMIERCRLTEASAALSLLKSKFLIEMNSNSTVAPYIKRWYDQYGVNDFTNLELKISTSRASCGAIGILPKFCQTGYEWDFTRLQCVPSGSTGGGIIGPGDGFSMQSMMPILLMAGVGLVIMMFAKR